MGSGLALPWNRPPSVMLTEPAEPNKRSEMVANP
jgi:hypothetical protein